MLKNQKIELDRQGNLLLAPLLENISELGGFDFNGQSVQYFSVADKAFVFAGKYPIRADQFIDKNDIDHAGPLLLKMGRTTQAP